MEERLSDFLRSHCTGGVALAFSGGVDSSLLLHALIRLREEKKEFPARSVLLPHAIPDVGGIAGKPVLRSEGGMRVRANHHGSSSTARVEK